MVSLRNFFLFAPKKRKKAGSSAPGFFKTINGVAFKEGRHDGSVSRLAGLHASTRFIELLLGLQLVS
jgi:hypothetical protein